MIALIALLSLTTQEVSTPPAALNKSGFYSKYIQADGYPIVASKNVNDYALKEAAYLVRMLLSRRPDVRDAMIKSGSRMCIIAHNEFTTDLPEFAWLGNQPMREFPTISGKDFWDARARGTGGSETDPYCSSAEENILGYAGDPYSTESIVIHEFAHSIHLRGMIKVDPTFDKRLKSAYDQAMKAGLWKLKYASVNHHEFFAEGVQSWFDNNREPDHDHNHVNTRAELLEYDPGLATMCKEVFGDTELRYTKPATRLTGHLEGYDPAKAPTFVWPERLTAAKAEIRKQAEARSAQTAEVIKPVRTEIISPIRNAKFNKGGKARKRVQGGNPRTVGGHLIFDGTADGNRQVDPQVAVGGNFVFHATNLGMVISDKKGNYVDGVPQSEFNGGIDPKLFFDVHNRSFVFDLWNPWDEAKLKPVNISVSETADPRGAWNTYPVPAPGGVDGGGIGYSRKWVGYSFPGGAERTFVMRIGEMKAGKPTTAFHFAGGLGQPVFTQDPTDDLLFVRLTRQDIILTTIGEGEGGTPVIKSVVTAPHNFRNFGSPPQSPMKGTTATTASGDRNPKNLVVQGKHLWFSHTVNVEGRAGVQWHQVQQDGKFIQSGLISDPVNSYIQTSIAVNKRNDLLIGFQETGPAMFISARCAWRKASDLSGRLRPTFPIAEGLAATEGGSWGDYSGSVVDGDNLVDLWTVQSVANSAGRGSTVIAKIKM